jgi:hypothetical protein
MDAYGTSMIYDSNQNLRMEENDDKKFNPEEVIRTFTKFLKEFQINNSFVYR